MWVSTWLQTKMNFFKNSLQYTTCQVNLIRVQSITILLLRAIILQQSQHETVVHFAHNQVLMLQLQRRYRARDIANTMLRRWQQLAFKTIVRWRFRVFCWQAVKSVLCNSSSRRSQLQWLARMCTLPKTFLRPRKTQWLTTISSSSYQQPQNVP
jgi:hypothetical protein